MITTRTPAQILRSGVGVDSAACLLCQWRSFNSSYRLLADKEASKSSPPESKATPKEVPDPPPKPPSPLADAPRSYGKAVEEFTPKPLSRPIGLPRPPRSGENAGVDTRSWRQRRDDFVDYEKHIVRRKELTKKISAPYFRDFSNMRHHKGKSFLAPPRLFKADKALYFPNFQGQTLLKDKTPKDTTPLFEDKVSVVSVFSSQWAENQAATFASEKQNPELHELVKSSDGMAQLVQINVEENALKAWIVRMFMGSLRKRLGEDNWNRYFLVRRGITDEIRDNIGLLNSKVGYTYLLDGECRIRWAGSGPSEGDEKESLVKGARRLVDELRARRKLRPLSTPKEAVKPGNVEKTAAMAA
ncbi:uncharacterized protein LY89DRAFT_640315 [Mollisia scopiformis]|uniref:Mitochondrial ATPase complex subunit ATP10 n=1 Tax=Mollisia scopiformis TaxID=149040 RepID=A0A194XK76_MOLSC|nr:uncharacterized protein LY89DRAFT_640315 [Mollisia scopiformis]KUJ20610.1 hypothetical protein LY89DRAFT_640315 [Mollisia scopiformis]